MNHNGAQCVLRLWIFLKQWHYYYHGGWHYILPTSLDIFDAKGYGLCYAKATHFFRPISYTGHKDESTYFTLVVTDMI